MIGSVPPASRESLMRRRWRRFRGHRRAYYSLLLLSGLFVASLFSELIANDRPLVMRFEGRTYFPVFFYYPAQDFGEELAVLTDYKRLAESEAMRRPGNWALFPPLRFGQNESMTNLPAPPPTRPTRVNWLGTDDRGRDLFTRLIYGFRNSMLFALASWAGIAILAYVIGGVQAFRGGRIDFYGQRLIEIWSSLPVLYVIIFLLSILPSSLWLLGAVWIAFSWISLSGYVRAEVLRVRKQDYITAARALGAGSARLLFRHILPNSLTPLLTFSPFLVAGSVGALAALDYLGLGLPPPAASWGELLRQGKENLTSWWLSCFPFVSLFSTIMLLNFIGEGARQAFDSRSQAR